MDYTQALQIREQFQNSLVREEDLFLFEEAMTSLIEADHKANDMLLLGSVYYQLRYFDEAQRYYEMAAVLDNAAAIRCLGSIWYYGRTGRVDNEKAFRYFSRAQMLGDLTAAYKVADMFRFGRFVDQNLVQYRKILLDLDDRLQTSDNVFDPVPEVFLRLAMMDMEEGNRQLASERLKMARKVLTIRLKLRAFFGDISTMKQIVLLQNVIEPLVISDCYKCYDLFDLFVIAPYSGCLEAAIGHRDFIICPMKEGGIEFSNCGQENSFFHKYYTVEEMLEREQIDSLPLACYGQEMVIFIFALNDKGKLLHGH